MPVGRKKGGGPVWKKKEDFLEGEKEMVSLQSLSELTGFPVELLKNELLLNNKVSSDNKISMEDLRKAMCCYLNSTMLEEGQRS